ncbi:MAG: branched-chain amino acid aminotransferase [Candidatus Ancillula sp.]|jgi:branched-chain amino acid aminotransferase|nr:branched-chain amino acid aminotransferase [Candidatus Ancillula sp.]
MSKFKFVEKTNKTTDEELAKIFENPGFGDYMSDHMAHIHYEFDESKATDPHNIETTSKTGEWSNYEIIPYGPISLEPAAAVFHYGQEIFEGLKAYKHDDGSIYTFRPELNAKRFQKSAHRLGLPDLSVEDFIDSIKEAVTIDKRWVQSGRGKALYIRPFMIASEPFLGVRPSKSIDYYCILSPVGDYFGTAKAVTIWIEKEYFRAGPGGTGAAKCGGNYAASLLPQTLAAEHGCSQVLYLNARDQKNIEELGGMSFVCVYKDGRVVTPNLNGNILDSVTRRTVLEVCREWGYDVQERELSLEELIEGIKSGEISEAFACGTAAVVAPIGEFKSDDFEVTLDYGDKEEGELTTKLRDEIVGIQKGHRPDTRGWLYKIC